MESQVHDALEVLRGEAGARTSDLQEIVDLVANICDCAYAAISVLDGDTYHLTTTHGLQPLECPRSHSLCRRTMDRHQTVVLTHLDQDAELLTSPYVNGTEMSLRFYASAPLYSPDGEMLGRLCVFDPESRDLTPLQVRSLDVLAAGVTDVLRLQLTTVMPVSTPEIALLAEQEIARIAAEISHDMRGPLATILGNVELLQESAAEMTSDATVVAMLERTHRAGQRLMGMVDQLLAFHRAGDNEVWESVDLDRLTRQLVLDLDQDLRGVQASVKIEQLPTVIGNGYQLGSVLLNLITNAIKFAKPGVPLELSIRCEDRGSRQRIRVLDNGIGVSPQAHNQVFRMFGRANGRVEGHGIGLATASRILRAHDGEMGMVSDGSSGTEVWFELDTMPPAPGTMPQAPAQPA